MSRDDCCFYSESVAPRLLFSVFDNIGKRSVAPHSAESGLADLKTDRTAWRGQRTRRPALYRTPGL